MLPVVLSVPRHFGCKSTAENFYVQKVCQPKQSFVCFGFVSLKQLTDVEIHYWLQLLKKNSGAKGFRWRTMWDWQHVSLSASLF